jgi:transcriptional regulator with XRE-family HTH domain
MGEVAMSTFAERLKELRFRKRISQKELAQKIGVSPSTVAAWEVGRNEPNYDMLKKLADFFGVSVD